MSTSWASFLPTFYLLRPLVLDPGSGTGQPDRQTGQMIGINT